MVELWTTELVHAITLRDIYGHRAFAVAGPRVWNSLPDNLREPDVTIYNLSACWKRFCFQHTSAVSAVDVLGRCALQIYILLTYLPTYLNSDEVSLQICWWLWDVTDGAGALELRNESYIDELVCPPPPSQHWIDDHTLGQLTIPLPQLTAG